MFSRMTALPLNRSVSPSRSTDTWSSSHTATLYSFWLLPLVRLLMMPLASDPWLSLVGRIHALSVSPVVPCSDSAFGMSMHALPEKLPARPCAPLGTVLPWPISVPGLSLPHASLTSPEIPDHDASSMCSASTQPVRSEPVSTSVTCGASDPGCPAVGPGSLTLPQPAQ